MGALQAAAELSAKYINDRHLPDKAIDVIDEAGAAQRILPANKRKKTITRSEVEEIVAKIARIPPASVSSDDRSKLKLLDRDLKSVVFGQDPAIDALAAAIKMARSGLGKPDKPIGSFLFSGPKMCIRDRPSPGPQGIDGRQSGLLVGLPAQPGIEQRPGVGGHVVLPGARRRLVSAPAATPEAQAGQDLRACWPTMRGLVRIGIAHAQCRCALRWRNAPTIRSA